MEQVVKAGAFVIYQDQFIFVVGPDGSNPWHGVVRLGGHREGDESPLECALREVQEEASLQIRPVPPPATYWAANATVPEPGPWFAHDLSTPPFLVTYYPDQGRRTRLTAIYLAYTDQAPRPAMETRGLLLLPREQLRELTRSQTTLGTCLNSGARALLRTELRPDWPLRPSHQVIMLDRLLSRHPELLPSRIDR